MLERVLNDHSDLSLIAFVKGRHAKRLSKYAQTWNRAERLALERVGRHLKDWDEAEYQVDVANITASYALNVIADVPPGYVQERSAASQVVWSIALGNVLTRLDPNAPTFTPVHNLRSLFLSQL